MPFLFSSDADAESLVEQLCRNNWWGQIIGPHGSGKSALLASLMPAIEQAGRQTRLIELHDGQRRLPKGWKMVLPRPSGLPDNAVETTVHQNCGRPTVFLVDGYEQLSRWNRLRLKWFCRHSGNGLVATAHHSVGLPDLFQPTIDLDLAWRIVQQLQQGRQRQLTREDLAERFHAHEGNLRETLFDLYDLYQRYDRQG